MANPFFERPILNSPYAYPVRHWELDDQGQPTQQIIERRRRAKFITPIPKPRKRKSSVEQRQIVFDEGKGLSTEQHSLIDLSSSCIGQRSAFRWQPLFGYRRCCPTSRNKSVRQLTRREAHTVARSEFAIAPAQPTTRSPAPGSVGRRPWLRRRQSLRGLCFPRLCHR